MSSRLASLATLILFSTSVSNALPARRDISLPTSWSSLGCYSDDVADRTLNVVSMSDATGMTANECISYCQGKGYSFAGTEYSQQCFCSNVLNVAASLLDSTSCDMPCSGDSTEMCGGAGAIDIYATSSIGSTPSAPSTAQSIGAWSYAGCYSDVVNARTLLNEQTLGATTNEACTAACQAQGYTFAGTEYADECYCGNAISNGGSVAGSGCDMVCEGSSTEFCGGSNRLTVYQYTAPVSSSSSTSSSTSTTSTSSSTSTSTTSSTSTSSSTTSSSSSTTTTTSSSSTTTTTSSSSSSTTSTSTSSSSSSTSTSAAVGNWQDVGCFAMSNVNLAKGVYLKTATTAATCQTSCASNGYGFAGFLFSKQCYCYPQLQTANGAIQSIVDTMCKLCDSFFGGACSQIEGLMHVYQFTGTLSSSKSSTTSSSTSTTSSTKSTTTSTTSTTTSSSTKATSTSTSTSTKSTSSSAIFRFPFA